MQISVFNASSNQVTLRGRCPHCGEAAAFLLVTGLGTATKRNQLQRVGAMQCQSCMDYIVSVFTQDQHKFTYICHYPLGKPDDRVDQEIPKHIQDDFKEALRCQFVEAWNATAEMCRRAVEASCIDLGVPVNKIKVLEGMIDWLEGQRKITPFLRDVAHKIRLGGNRGAHPPEGGPEIIPSDDDPVLKIEKDHALAIVRFTREFFHHVYVVPKQLEQYDFSKPKPAKPT